jgi:hypothetical protein
MEVDIHYLIHKSGHLIDYGMKLNNCNLDSSTIEFCMEQTIDSDLESHW